MSCIVPMRAMDVDVLVLWLSRTSKAFFGAGVQIFVCLAIYQGGVPLRKEGGGIDRLGLVVETICFMNGIIFLLGDGLSKPWGHGIER
jgi:hypothetical protein